jgi:hypothetical protein
MLSGILIRVPLRRRQRLPSQPRRRLLYAFVVHVLIERLIVDAIIRIGALTTALLCARVAITCGTGWIPVPVPGIQVVVIVGNFVLTIRVVLMLRRAQGGLTSHAVTGLASSNAPT